MTRFLSSTLLFCSFLCAAPAAILWSDSAAARGLDTALPLIRAENWSAALSEAGAANSIPRDVVEWHRLRAGEGSAAEVMAFLTRRPSWPGESYLRRQSETAFETASDSTVLAFFAHTPPQTPEGALRFAQALRATGQRKAGDETLVAAWRSMPMRAETQAAFLSGNAKLLRPHHGARLDRLLWDNHMVSADRMLDLVAKDVQALAKARIALQKRSKGVDSFIAAVPSALREDAGLAYDRFAWRDAKGRRDDAVAMMAERSTSAQALGEPAKWLRRRRDFARQLMRDGENRAAYELAAQHFATPEDGYGYADCEWIAGYVALQKLQDPERAVYHFTRFLAAVKTPVSVGRAGYWLGRAYGEIGDIDKAHAAYRLGAKYQSSFYGILAAQALGRPYDPLLRAPQDVSWRDAPFLKSSVAQAGLALLEAGDTVQAERFLTHLVESLPPEQALQMGHMAVDMNEPHLAVMISKRAAQSGLELPGAYYPLHPIAKQDLPMTPEMTLAIARRESEFDPSVISHAGARGLMQVMPATAKRVADTLGLKKEHSTGRLTSDWAYNARLGAQYLAMLAEEFNGNVVLMAAGYNAGPHRPIAWMERYGDPRDPKVDVIDWIEHIPFEETRNYVMRVTESLPVYRARLGKDPLPQPFLQELTGSTLSLFTPKGK